MTVFSLHVFRAHSVIDTHYTFPHTNSSSRSLRSIDQTRGSQITMFTSVAAFLVVKHNSQL